MLPEADVEADSVARGREAVQEYPHLTQQRSLRLADAKDGRVQIEAASLGDQIFRPPTVDFKDAQCVGDIAQMKQRASTRVLDPGRDVASGIRAAVDELNATLSDDVTITITSDDAVFIETSIEAVIVDLLIATLIVVAIIYLFLRSLRLTFIPAVTVPIALFGTIGAIYLAGFSVNILTLLALVLATGLVVDDAIVVIENISRQRALGLGPRAAAVLGTRQVFFAVLSTTATLAAVFIPISFFPGLTGSLFAEFGFVLAFAVTLSCFVALTLSPMLASRLISEKQAHHEHNAIGRRVAAFGERIIHLYARLLDAALKAPMVVIVAALLFAGAAVAVFNTLPSELTPKEDRGFVPISVSVPQGSTVDYTEAQMRQVEQIAAAHQHHARPARNIRPHPPHQQRRAGILRKDHRGGEGHCRVHVSSSQQKTVSIVVL